VIEETKRLNEEAARRRSEIERQRLELEQEARIRTEEEARHRVTDSYRRMEEQEARLASERLEQSVTETPGEVDPAAPAVPATASDHPAWLDVNLTAPVKPVEGSAPAVPPVFVAPTAPAATAQGREIEVVRAEKGITQSDGDIPAEITNRLNSSNPNERAAGLLELAKLPGDDSFRLITTCFDDPALEVRNAAARALHDLQPDRAATFTRALREGSPERRRRIGASLADSGLAVDAIDNLTGESRERTYDAFSLLFLMAKAGEVQPLMNAIEEHDNTEVRLAVVKLLALSGQPEIVPAFRRLAVRGSLPSEVRSAVMEAIYQISSQARETTSSAA
jgi:hypothetical protein